MPTVGVEFAKVSYTLAGGRVLLRDVSLQLEAGSTTALLGRSGSGKTTLLRMVNGLVAPTSGEVRVCGEATGDYGLVALRRGIGYVIQETGLFPHMTVERNAGMGLELAGYSRMEVAERARELLGLVGMDFEEFRGRYPWQLSGGQKQRVGLARALAMDPGVLLMDEPFGALDPLTRAEMQTMLRGLLERVKKTLSGEPGGFSFGWGGCGGHAGGGGFGVGQSLCDELCPGCTSLGAKMLAFLHSHGWEIARLTFEHLWLTVSAMLLAAGIGLPLGILLSRQRRFAGPVIGFANVVQTVPSLALFGLLLPVPWLGENAARLAILALTGYALLPILRNTYAGIGSVDEALADVADAMGMTSWQRLIKVELPIAASVILAGVRTATVTCVGVATIAAAIGAGGLGELIFRGVASVDNGLVLAGAIPAALLALVADAGLGLLERRLTVRRV